MIFTPKDLEITCRKFKRKNYQLEEFLKLNQLFKEDYLKFFEKLATKYIEWNKNFWDVLDDSNSPFLKWFTKGRFDICYNVYEKFLETHYKNKAAIIWEGIDGTEKIYTYHTLHYEVEKLAYCLKQLGIKKGSKVFIFMPDLPEVIITILACAKLGAIHIVYNYKFSSEALYDRINDAKPDIILTADGSFEEGYYKVKGKIDEIFDKIENIVKYIIIVKRTGRKIKVRPFKELWYHELIDSTNFNDALLSKKRVSESEDPLFIFYTPTNYIQPKGLIHSAAGYLLWIFFTTDLIFDIKDTDTYWCTFELSSIVGLSYTIYGPLSLGATVFIFEGRIDYESANRFYEIIDKHNITILYTHPHILRNLMNAYLKKKVDGNSKSLKLIATTGETVKLPLLRWCFETLGNKVTPIIDIWFQAEAGGALVSSLPCLVPPKPESIAKPLPGVDIALVDSMGNELKGETTGTIVIKKPHPSLLRNIFNDSSTYLNYWNRYRDKTLFFTGDSAYRDKDDYIFLKGRIDNIINIEGKRISLLEVESVISKIKNIDECAVISYNHPRKGSILAAFCVPDSSVANEWQLAELEQEIKSIITRDIGEWINLQEIRFTQGLPKSPSGKLLRDLLKEVALGME